MKNRIETYDDLIDNCSHSLYEQSTKVSNISRGIIYALIGTVWVISYVDGHFIFPRGWLLVTVIICLCFLLVDLVHYFVETCFYHREAHNVHNNRTDSYLPIHNKRMIKRSRRSLGYIITKFSICLLAMASFIIDLLCA